MKRTIATVLLVAVVLGAVVFAVLNRPKKEIEILPSVSTAETGVRDETKSTSETTEKPDDHYKAGPRTTEAASYGDSKIADLCELMKNITGTRVVPSFAKVEDFFGTGFYHSYMALQVSSEVYKSEKIYTYYNYMQASADELKFNRFIFTANEEYGNLYMVELVNSNSKHDNSLKPSPFSKEEMMDYYSLLEKELTKTFGNPTSSKPLDKEKGGMAFSEYRIDEECTFRVEIRNSAGSEYVSLKCTNSAERKHFLIHEDKGGSDSDFEKDNYYKPAGKDDIVRDSKTGYVYVKNQLLVSFKLGTPNDMEKMNAICNEIGAKVVGYLKLSGDFQIEFDRDLTCEELLKIAEELKEKYYFVSYVSLNLATEGDGLD